MTKLKNRPAMPKAATEAARLTKEQRSEIARKGALARKERVLTHEAEDGDHVEHEGVLNSASSPSRASSPSLEFG